MAKIHGAKVGEVVNKIAIRVGYDAYFEQLIVGTFLKALPRPDRKRPPTYEVLKPMPDEAAYAALRSERFTSDAGSLFEDAKSEAETLGEELREWHGNLPDGLNNSDKASEIDDAASTHENISWPDVPECAEGVRVYHLPSLDADSRPKRNAEVVAKLDNVISALESHRSEMEEHLQEAEAAKDPGPNGTKEEWDKFGEQHAAAERSREEARLSEDDRMHPGEENTAYYESAPKAAAVEAPVDTAQLGEDIEELRQFIQDLENVKGELEDISYPAMM